MKTDDHDADVKALGDVAPGPEKAEAAKNMRPYRRRRRGSIGAQFSPGRIPAHRALGEAVTAPAQCAVGSRPALRLGEDPLYTLWADEVAAREVCEDQDLSEYVPETFQSMFGQTCDQVLDLFKSLDEICGKLAQSVGQHCPSISMNGNYHCVVS
jgi:hypothetical protein